MAMDAYKEFLKVEKSARIFKLGNLSGGPKNIWIALHGYRELGPYFSRKFQNLAQGNNAVIIPEGLNRFYIEGYSGKVGANWMTKEDRAVDIADNINYLNKVYETYVEPHLHEYTQVNVLAFSQGSATASRWLCSTHFKVHNLVFWGGSVAPDINHEKLNSKFNTSNFWIFAGDNDQFISEERWQQETQFLAENNYQYNLVPYKGEHKIYPELFHQHLPFLNA